MSQHDYIVDNQDGFSFRADINAVLQAIVSQNSGTTAPATPYAFQFWADTTNGVIKQRNAANSAWTTVATIGKTLVANDSNQLAAAWVNFNGTGTVAIRRAYNVSSITDNGVADYTVNFTNALSSADYCYTFGAQDNTVGPSEYLTGESVSPTTTALRINVWASNGSQPDVTTACVAIFN